MKMIIPLLTVLFIGLKLAEIIDWSWAWVLSPLWIITSFIVILAVSLLGISTVSRRLAVLNKKSIKKD